NRFNLSNFDPLGGQTDKNRQYRLGGRFDAAPGVTLVAVWTQGNENASMTFGPTIFSSASTVNQSNDANTGEAAVYLTGDSFNIVAGLSALSGGDRVSSLSSTSTLGIDDHSFWLYGNLGLSPTARLTIGGDFDQLHTTADGIDLLRLTQFNPKVGVSWDVLPST